MACLLKLVRLTDFAADIDSVDLFGNGIELADEGYHPAVAGIGETSVIESITLKIKGTSKNDLASIVQTLDAKIKEVQWWIEAPGVERYQVWIRAQLDNESQPRQSQIISIQPSKGIRVYNPVEVQANYIGEYTITIERTPFWEMPYPYPTTTEKTSINTIGGTSVLAETINGDVPARIAKLSLGPSSGAGFQSEYYIGWRSERFGLPHKFEPVWSCDDGYSFTDVTSTADASAYSGNMMVCDFSTTESLNWRVSWFLSDVTAWPADQRGEYQVLLRARMSDNVSVARARLAFSFGIKNGVPERAEPMNPTYRSRVVIDGAKIYSTDWSLFELGTMSIPPYRVDPTASFISFAAEIDAERYSGSGNLHLDCIILIPSAEGYAHMKLDRVNLEATDHCNLYQYADDTTFAVSDSNTTILNAVAPHSAIKWGLPPNGTAPYFFVAAQRYMAPDKYRSLKNDTCDLIYTYIPRWRTLRGNET